MFHNSLSCPRERFSVRASPSCAGRLQLPAEAVAELPCTCRFTSPEMCLSLPPRDGLLSAVVSTGSGGPPSLKGYIQFPRAAVSWSSAVRPFIRPLAIGTTAREANEQKQQTSGIHFGKITHEINFALDEVRFNRKEDRGSPQHIGHQNNEGNVPQKFEKTKIVPINGGRNDSHRTRKKDAQNW